MHVDLREFRSAYLAEVDEHLSAVNALLVELDSAAREKRTAPRSMRELMRLLHTVKGLSAMVGVDPIVTIAHRMENVLRASDRAASPVDERAIEALIRGARAIESRVQAVAGDKPVPEPPPALLAELDALELGEGPFSSSEVAGPPSPPRAPDLDPAVADKLSASEREQIAQGAAAGQRVVRIDFAPSPERAEQGLTITSVRERLAKLGEIVRVLPLTMTPNAGAPGGLVFAVIIITPADDAAIAEAAGAKPADVRLVLAPAAASGSSARTAAAPMPAYRDDGDEDGTAGRSGVLRVEVSRVDDAIEKLSALIVTRWRLQHALDALAATGAPVRDLAAIVAENARQLRDMRAAILRVRMVPIASMFDRVPLVVRGLAKTTKKQVRLVTEGGGAELDKTVAERLFPALVHLLRNAVDHGVESPEERTAAGKDPQALLRITAATRNRQVEIRIEDDGRGVDRAAVAKKAGAPIPTDDAGLLDLMCRSGLSTRSEADTTSGRGLGLDIVRKIVVDSLGGELLLETRTGEGTCFVLRVPLTIAIVDAFVASCAGARYVVPVPVVEEIVPLEENARDLIVRRGEPVPVVDLAAALGAKTDGLRRAHALVVRRTHDDPVAFAIDRVLGQQETVVRPLVDPLVAVPGVSGSTDLGDGRATLVLDLHGLVARLGAEPRRLPEHAS